MSVTLAVLNVAVLVGAHLTGHSLLRDPLPALLASSSALTLFSLVRIRHDYVRSFVILPSPLNPSN